MICSDGFEWKSRVLAKGPCVAHDDPSDCDGEMRCHHVITQQSLRRHGFVSERWNTDGGVPVCELAHRRHHAGHTRIRRDQLPPEAIRFAERLGLGWMIDRYYPST